MKVILFHSIKDIIPSKSELLEIYGKLNINQFEILDDCAEDVLGSGLYLAASIIGTYPTQKLPFLYKICIIRAHTNKRFQ